VQNNVKELWALFDFLTASDGSGGLLGDWRTFRVKVDDENTVAVGNLMLAGVCALLLGRWFYRLIKWLDLPRSDSRRLRAVCLWCSICGCISRVPLGAVCGPDRARTAPGRHSRRAHGGPRAGQRAAAPPVRSHPPADKGQPQRGRPRPSAEPAPTRTPEPGLGLGLKLGPAGAVAVVVAADGVGAWRIWRGHGCRGGHGGCSVGRRCGPGAAAEARTRPLGRPQVKVLTTTSSCLVVEQ